MTVPPRGQQGCIVFEAKLTDTWSKAVQMSVSRSPRCVPGATRSMCSARAIGFSAQNDAEHPRRDRCGVEVMAARLHQRARAQPNIP
eukprot:5133611-Alexandrium_andersonii.AAC.1